LLIRAEQVAAAAILALAILLDDDRKLAVVGPVGALLALGCAVLAPVVL